MRIGRQVQRAVTGLHSRIYRATGGRIGGRLGRTENVLLITVGRHSGKQRTTPLIGVRDGDSVLLVASNGGARQHPDWYFNLSADPVVTIQRGADRLRMRARTATPDERARLWPKVVQVFSNYAEYQKKAAREIPLVICEADT